MTYPSGNFYEGNWKYDKKEGYGMKKIKILKIIITNNNKTNK